MDFKNQTKENWNARNGKTQNVIKIFCLPFCIQIDDCKDHNNQFEILIKLILAAKLNTKLKNQYINYIIKVGKTYNKVF